jgi:hypothetical protein
MFFPHSGKKFTILLFLRCLSIKVLTSDTYILTAVSNNQNSLILFLKYMNKNSFVPYILNFEENILVKIFLESL